MLYHHRGSELAIGTGGPKPHFISPGVGLQFRVWTLGRGPLLVVLPGLLRSPQQRAIELATTAKGWTIVSVEVPGIGASELPATATLESFAKPIAAWLDGMPAPIPMACFDFAGPLGLEVLKQSQKVRKLTWLDKGAWDAAIAAPQAGPAGELSADGGHLSRLWHHVRDLDILDAGSRNRARRSGAEFLSAQQLDEAFICFATQPGGYTAHWRLSTCHRGSGLDGPRLDAAPGASVETPGDIATVDCTELPGITGLFPREGVHDASVRRVHVDIPRGCVHLRCSGTGRRLLIALLGGASSSAILAPLVRGMSDEFIVVAPDYIGQGDSCRAPGKTSIGELGQDVLHLATSLGFEHFDLYGTHTGAYVALEAGIAGKGRVRRIILDGMGLSPPESRLESSESYFPTIQPDAWGLHALKAWNVRRDQGFFFPWFMGSPRAARAAPGFQLASVHDRAIATLRSQTTPAYRAAICDYDARQRIGLLEVQTWLAAGPRDTFIADLRLGHAFASAHLRVSEIPATVWFPGETQDAVASTLDQFKAFLGQELSVPPLPDGSGVSSPRSSARTQTCNADLS